MSRYLKRLGRGLAYGSVLSIVGGSAVVLHRNDYDLSSIGAMRLARAVVAVGRIIVDYEISALFADPQSSRSACHQRGAEKLLKLACDNGGVWIKVGQHLGSLEYLLPEEYVRTLSVLHSKAPKSSLEDVHHVIQTSLGAKPDEIFDHFEAEPIGAASLAQVHKAQLKDGRMVAVKVQHKRVKAHSFVDIKTMEFLVKVVTRLFPEFKFAWLVEQMKANVPLELDFVHEGKNAERIKRMLAHLKFLKVPEILWDYSSDRVLLMEYCEGGQVNDLHYMKQQKINPYEVCKYIGEMYSDMIFVHGYVHCDPHPGNVLVHHSDHKGLQIILLDHGLYTTLTDSFRMRYANLWLSLLSADTEGIKRWSDSLGVGDLAPLFACMVTARSWESVTEGIDKKVLTSEENDYLKANMHLYLPQITEVLQNVPKPMILVLKTNDLLRGIEASLKTQHSAFAFLYMSKCCVKAVHAEDRKNCESIWCRLRSYRVEYWRLFTIRLYETFLVVRDFWDQLWMKSNGLALA